MKSDGSSGLSVYLRQIGKRKLLTKEQEVELSQKIEGELVMPDGSKVPISLADQKRAKDRMIEANLRLVVSIAKGQQRRGCDIDDLIAEGNIGLMRAVDRFDWRRGFRFSTYASWWIRQAVGRLVANQGKSIRVPGRMGNLSTELAAARADFIELNGQEPTREELADLMGVTESTVMASMSGLPRMMSLDAQVGGGPEGDGQKMLRDTIPDTESETPFDVVDGHELKHLLSRVLGTLSSREEKIIRLRFGITENPRDHEAFPITRGELHEIEMQASEVA